MSLKTAVLKLTGAVLIDGVIMRAGQKVELIESEAKALLQRGKAVLHEVEEDVEQLVKGGKPAPTPSNAPAAAAPAAPAAPSSNGAGTEPPAPAAAGGAPSDQTGGNSGQ